MSIACPACDETGCDDCGGTGFVELTSCPKQMIDREIYRAIRLADMMKEGIPPIAGGVLDQSAWFISFYECFRSELAKAESESYRRA